MIRLEREVSTPDLHLSMAVIELLIPIIDKLVCFDFNRSFLFYLHFGHLTMRGKRRAQDEEEQTGTQNEPAISQDRSLGRK